MVIQRGGDGTRNESMMMIVLARKERDMRWFDALLLRYCDAVMLMLMMRTKLGYMPDDDESEGTEMEC